MAKSGDLEIGGSLPSLELILTSEKYLKLIGWKC